MSTRPHISVCVCAFKRSALVLNLLRHLEHQRTDDLFDYDVVICDNDAARSSEEVVTTFAAGSALPVTYCVEPQQNIALARNRSLTHATGDWVAFIDDDETPTDQWLYRLFQTARARGVDGVLGPVLPRYEQEPPSWIVKGRFFDRPRYPTGTPVQWPEARTGNVLLANGVWRTLDPPFRTEFDSGGEDVDFFRELSERGHAFVWCDEAPVHELVPSYRCTRGFLFRRAVLRGSNFPKQSGRRLPSVIKSIIAVPCYTIALPALALVGHHHFVAYLVKLLDHTSRLLALAGLRLSTQRET